MSNLEPMYKIGHKNNTKRKIKMDEILRYFPNKIYQIFSNLLQENHKLQMNYKKLESG